MRKSVLVASTLACLALAGAASAENFNPQPDPPGRSRQAMLNPQPLPPGRYSRAMLNPQPLPPRWSGRVALNPQPLPPGARTQGNGRK